MTVTDEARDRLRQLRGRAGDDCVGFLFEGALGTCRGSSPVLRPVDEPVEDAESFPVGDLILYARDEFAELLEQASFHYDGAFFGRGLTIQWPHREHGCPHCR